MPTLHPRRGNRLALSTTNMIAALPADFVWERLSETTPPVTSQRKS